MAVDGASGFAILLSFSMIGVAVLVLLAFLLGLTADGPPWFVLIGTFCIGVAVAEGLTALADIAIHRRNNAPTNQRKAP